MWNRFSFIWTQRPCLDHCQTPTLCCSHIRPPYKLEAEGGIGMYFALCDVIVCREMGWPCPLMPHTHMHTHWLWPNWRCVRQTCWVQEVWDPFTTSSRRRTEDPVSWSQDGTIMSLPAATTTSFQVLLRPLPPTFLLHGPNSCGITTKWQVISQKEIPSLKIRLVTQNPETEMINSSAI